MTGSIPVPSKGDGLRASWGAAVARAVNALGGMAPAGMLVREGVGCGCEPLPRNLRDRRADATDAFPYAVSSIARDAASGTYTVTVRNPYYRCGGKTYLGSATTLSGVAAASFLALRIDTSGSAPSDALVAYANAAALNQGELDADRYVLPLYKLDAYGKIEVDFRAVPTAAMWEFQAGDAS